MISLPHSHLYMVSVKLMCYMYFVIVYIMLLCVMFVVSFFIAAHKVTEQSEMDISDTGCTADILSESLKF